MEAFSDGVIAILITIMVLDLKTPAGTDLQALRPLVPTLLSYLLSYIYIGIYWNNHHHMLQAAHRVTGGVLWANLHLLFWISLLPFATRWSSEAHFTPLPTAMYGVILLMSGAAYLILQKCIIAAQREDSKLAVAVGRDWKGKLSLILYATAVPLAFASPSMAAAVYVVVALIWLIPDRRIEKRLNS